MRFNNMYDVVFGYVHAALLVENISITKPVGFGIKQGEQHKTLFHIFIPRRAIKGVALHGPDLDGCALAFVSMYDAGYFFINLVQISQCR